MANQWFRFYSETLRDRKLERIARATGNDKVTLLGIWITLLSLANDSPERGVLLLVDNIPLTFDDFCYETEIDSDQLQPIIERFMKFDMLSCDDGIYYITNWGKRQFKSDTSKERVQRYRERKAQENGEPSNDTVTLLQQPSNAPESETESETESEQNQNKTPLRVFFEELSTAWHNYYPDKRQYGYDTVKAKIAARYKDKGFRENWTEALLKSCNVKALRDEKWFSFEYLIRNNTNYLKLLDGTFAFKDGDKRTDREPPKLAKVAIADDPDNFFKA